LETAALFLGAPYMWGGLTPAGAPGTIKSPTGIDCSGLTYLSFRVHGVAIPRDSYEQWMKATPIRRAALQPADLVFSAKTIDPKKVVHVAFYTGDGQLIEAPQAGIPVRRISFKEKFGADLSQVESGQTVGDHVVYFGSFLSE